MSGKSPFQIFAEYGGKQHALVERKKKHRAQADAFPELTIEDPTGDERYTTRETIAWCMERAGVDAFDLDVAACEESHHAPRFYTKADDGLKRPWDAERIWCNPPYSDIEPWIAKAWAEWHDTPSRFVDRTIAMLIPATRTEQPWWQRDVEPRRDGRGWRVLWTYNLPGRTAFARPGSGGVGQSGAPFGCVLLVWRRT